MKTYQSHKKVQAAKITKIGRVEVPNARDPLGQRYLELTLDDGTQVQVGGGQFENVAVGGYFVRYDDKYTSYSPAKAFEEGYTEIGAIEVKAATGLNYGQALEALKLGKCIAREGWNSKGMFAYFVPANAYPAQTGAAKAHFGENGMVPYNAYMALKGADGTVSTWAPSGSDSLAEDWCIVDPEKPSITIHKTTGVGWSTTIAGGQVAPTSALPSVPCSDNVDRAQLAALGQLPGPFAAYPPHQQRVLEERRDLLDKAEKLNKFFNTGTFNGLDLDERSRLRKQLAAMYAYGDILAERIAAFDLPVKATVPAQQAADTSGLPG